MAVCCGLVYQNDADIKNNQRLKKARYNWILQHSEVVVSPIENYCLKLSINCQVEPQLFTKFSFQISVRELHNITLIPPEEGGLKEERYSYTNTIISASNLRNNLQPQLKNMTY